MAEWEHGGGFSVDAKVRIEAHEREDLERLLRYCARPAFALEWLRDIDPGHLVYESVKPGPGRSVSLMLTSDYARRFRLLESTARVFSMKSNRGVSRPRCLPIGTACDRAEEVWDGHSRRRWSSTIHAACIASLARKFWCRS